MPLDATALERFKKTIENKIPVIHKLDLTDEQWQDLNTYLQENKGKRKSATSASFLIWSGLETICKLPYPLLIEKTRDKQPARSCKKTSDTSKSPISQPTTRKRPLNPDENKLIVASDCPLSPTLKKFGVVERPIEASDTSKQDVTTPDGKKVRPYFKNAKVSFWTYITPEKKDTLKDQSSVDKARKKLFDSGYEQAPKQHFVATAETLRQPGQKRLCSQIQLTGIPAKEVHVAHGDDNAARTGQYYHWAHNITHSLGGPQNKDNLIPTTRECNLGMYKLYEREVAKQVQNNGLTIEIIGTPHYPDEESLIPSQVVTQLDWSNGYTETLFSKPLSQTKLSTATLASIQHARQSALNALVESENTDSENPGIALS